MIRSIFALALALTLATGAAARDFELIEGAYELSLTNVIMPNSQAGVVVFKDCGACESTGRAVGTGTRYLIGERELPLPDFLAAVEELRASPGAQNSFVGVYYDLKTNAITRIAVIPETTPSAVGARSKPSAPQAAGAPRERSAEGTRFSGIERAPR
jgi:hypothetical protein